MKSKAIISAITVAALSFSTLSFAQSNYDRHGPGGQPQRFDQRGPQVRVDNNDQRNDHGPQGFDNHRDARNDRRNFDPRGPQFHRGGRLPSEYRGRQYVVNDWRGHHLNAPPRGQQWVQVGADYALVAIATGVIASIILNH